MHLPEHSQMFLRALKNAIISPILRELCDIKYSQFPLRFKANEFRQLCSLKNIMRIKKSLRLKKIRIHNNKKNSAERKALPHYLLHEINYLTVLMYWISSTTLLEYPHSLSYQATTFTKLGFSEIPASASKMEVRASCIKSEETTASSV